MTFLDCGGVFIKGGAARRAAGGGIDAALMADAIHPTGAGWDKLGACMAPTVGRLYDGAAA